MKTLLNTLIFLFLLVQNISANEYRGGHISVTQLSASSIQADIELLIDIHGEIDEVQLCWGDGFCQSIAPISIETLAGYGLKKYTYNILHSYPDQGTYTLFIEDCCFDDEIQNMLNAEDDPFVIETRITLGASFNTTPYYSSIAADIGPTNELMTVLGWDDDPEGDEYETELCDIDVDTYVRPDISFPVPGNVIFNDTINGEVLWGVPPANGTFLLQTCVSEYRNGEEISFTKRVICFLVGNFSATAEPIGASDFSIYPNPIQDKKLWIQNSNAAKFESLNISIHNISQQRVFAEATNTAFDNKMINLDGLSAGVYFILMETADATYYEKFLIVE